MRRRGFDASARRPIGYGETCAPGRGPRSALIADAVLPSAPPHDLTGPAYDFARVSARALTPIGPRRFRLATYSMFGLARQGEEALPFLASFAAQAPACLVSGGLADVMDVPRWHG